MHEAADAITQDRPHVAAGADVLFVEAIRSAEEAQQVTSRFGVPLLYNFVETGKSPLLPAGELERLGFKLVIYPSSAMLTVCKTVAHVFQELKEKGTTAHLTGDMVSLMDYFNLLGLSETLTLDASYAE